MKQMFDKDYFNMLDESLSFSVAQAPGNAHGMNGTHGAYVPRTGEGVCITVDRKRDAGDFIWRLFGGRLVSAQEAHRLVKSGRKRLHFIDWSHEFPETVRAFWAFEDTLGIPYYKDWRELIVAHRNATEPLVYTRHERLPSLNYKVTGLWDQAQAYRVANALLGLEEHADVLLDVFHTRKRLAFVCGNYRIPVPKAARLLPDGEAEAPPRN